MKETAKILMIRQNRNDPAEQPLVDRITLPARYIENREPHKAEASVDLFIRKILADYQETHDIRFENPSPADFLSLPTDFLAKHGITVEPIDAPLVVLYSMDEDMSDIEILPADD